jgi:internalin A
LTKSALYALVVDTRRDDSEQLDLELYWWLSAVELLSDNSHVFIIKNEKDDRFFQINEPALRERFSNLLNQVHSSNFTTNRGRENILDTLKYQISHLPHVGKPLPKTWVKVRRALENDLRNYIPVATYLKLCQQHGFKNHQDALHLSQTLHNLGVCLHFQDNDLLAKTVFLKPEWGTAAVYQILDNDKIKRDFGHFDRADLHTIWHDEQYAGIHGELLELMKKFELCYELPEKNHYIAPQLLENQRPANYHWDNHDNLQLRYTYPQFMPKGILSRFIVNIHESIAKQRRCVWLTGVVLEKDHTRAEVTENYPLKTIQIRVAGRHKRDLITIIVHELDKIHNSYHDRLKFHRLISY